VGDDDVTAGGGLNQRTWIASIEGQLPPEIGSQSIEDPVTWSV
jgi:hypothetical protein